MNSIEVCLLLLLFYYYYYYFTTQIFVLIGLIKVGLCLLFIGMHRLGRKEAFNV